MRVSVIVCFFSLSNFVTSVMPKTEEAPEHVLNRWKSFKYTKCSQIRRGRLLLHTLQSGWNSLPLKTGAKSSVTFLAAKSSKYLQRALFLGRILILESTRCWPAEGRARTSLCRPTSAPLCFQFRPLERKLSPLTT